MRRSSHRALALLLPVLIIFSSARAQNPSHEIDPDLAPPRNVSKLLDPKRQKRSANLDVEMMRRLLEFMPRNIDPKDVDPKMVQQFLRDNPEFRDPENLKKLRDLAEEQKRVPPNPNDPNPPVDWNRMQDQIKRLDEVRKNQPVDPKNMNDRDPVVRPPVERQDPPQRTQSTPPRPKQNKNDRDFKWLTKTFGNSPEMKNMAKDFARIWGSDKNKGGGFLKDLEKQWKSLSGSSGKDGGGSNLKDLAGKLKMPDGGSNDSGSGRNASTGGGSGGSGGGSSSPSSGGGGGFQFGGGSGEGSWTPLIILLVLGVAGFLLYRYYKRQPETVEETPVDTVRVWPVDPMQVNSREDVVKAFEFLSVSKCGDDAINWHHIQIAGQLGAQEPNHKDAAARLARLYEKARYTPANELFDDLDIAEARARFTQLAGATPA